MSADVSCWLTQAASNSAGVKYPSAEGILYDSPVSEDEQTFDLVAPVVTTPYVRAQLVEPGADEWTVCALTNPIYLKEINQR